MKFRPKLDCLSETSSTWVYNAYEKYRSLNHFYYIFLRNSCWKKCVRASFSRAIHITAAFTITVEWSSTLFHRLVGGIVTIRVTFWYDFFKDDIQKILEIFFCEPRSHFLQMIMLFSSVLCQKNLPSSEFIQYPFLLWLRPFYTIATGDAEGDT